MKNTILIHICLFIAYHELYIIDTQDAPSQC